ncbi:hypothetical protein [Demequina litorisediminis]|uniref:hypothetical protein n=1 Tax=Demequina litorisediminis TaxID=1849022 RepID=UPI0024E157F2|nr:hypothetical protein [Demequina litorisediminis]
MTDLVREWKAALGADLSVAEALHFEALFAAGAADISEALPPNMSYLKTLHTIRERAALALYDYAREINWRRPVLFVRALAVARGYLRDVVGHSDLTSAARRKEFTGRLGVATVLAARFSTASPSEVSEAIYTLTESLKQGNDPASAVPYLIEAAVLRFDIERDPAALLSQVRSATAYMSKHDYECTPAAQLASCDAYLRLASVARPRARQAAIEQAATFLQNALRNSPDSDDAVRALLLDVLIEACRVGPEILDGDSILGLRLPFGARLDPPSTLLKTLAAAMAARINDRALAGDLLARGVCADLLTLSSAETQVEQLRTAVDLRRGSEP